MFIGYLKSDFEENLEELFTQNPLLDISLLKQTYTVFPEYCFAAYEKTKIVGVLSAYVFEKYVYVNVLEVIEKYEDVFTRLISLLLKNIPNENVVLLVENKKSIKLMELGFKEFCNFKRMTHSGEAVAFNFSNSTAKQVSGEHYDEVSKRIDKKVFHQNREDYIKKDCVFY